MKHERKPNESHGADFGESERFAWAEAVSDLVNRLRLEIFGPKGKE